MVNKSFNIDVDIKESLTNRPFEVVQGDTGNIINISVLDDGQPVDLTGCRVLAVFSKSSGTSSQDSGVPDGGITISGNTVQLQLFTSSFDVGMIECELQIYSDAEMSTMITTAKFNFKARKGILNKDTLQSTNEYPTLTQLIKQVEDMAGGIPWLPSAGQGDAVFVGPAGQLQGKAGEDARAALGITPVNIGAAPASIIRTGTLLASAWTGSEPPFSQTIAVPGLSAGAKGTIGLPQSATIQQYSASAGLFLTAQAADGITVMATAVLPTIDIPFLILAENDQTDGAILSTFPSKIGKEGYIPPLTEDDFTYTGNYILVDDGEGHWRIKFLTSGVFTSTITRVIDIFCCGGGGSGARGNAPSGGAGGYTNTFRQIILYGGTEYSVEVGAGGARTTAINTNGLDGGKSSFGIYEAPGGQGGRTGNPFAGGGSGAGAPGSGEYGSNGSDGGSDGYNGGGTYGGPGQGKTTKEFAEDDGDLYGAAAGGAGTFYSSSFYRGGDGGLGGDSTFSAGKGTSPTQMGAHPTPFGGESVLVPAGSGAGAGYGAGGGAMGYYQNTQPIQSGAGYQGIVIIRDHRENTNILPLRTPLAEALWEFIGQNAGRASDAWKIGDTKTIPLNSALFGSPEITVRIVGFNHDDLADGSGKAGIAFCMEFLANIPQLMNAAATNSQGWGDAQFRSVLKNQAYYAIPKEVRDVIKLVKKKTAQAGNNASAPIVETEDYLFLGSEYELFGTTTQSVAGEGLQYAYFTTDSARKKVINTASGSPGAYLLRSPAKGSATSYASVTTAGAISTISANTATYVALLFCV